jgi:hypothetical protein
MDEVLAFSRDHFGLLFLFGVLWVGLMAFLAGRRRVEHGMPLRPAVPRDARFSETWTSGRSRRSAFARLGGANNCLIVAVTDKALVIHPHFPFNLVGGQLLGLDQNIPREKIRKVSESGGIFGRTVEVEFETSSGRETVELRLRDPKAFIAALQG